MSDSDSLKLTLTINLRDQDALYAAYMPFLTYGGLFIATDQRFEIGDVVELHVRLPDDVETTTVEGRVVWLNPRATAGRPAGVGVHFHARGGSTLHKRIEALLAPQLKSVRPTYTM